MELLLHEREAGLLGWPGAACSAAAFGHRPALFTAATAGNAGLGRRFAEVASLGGHAGAVNALAWSECGGLLAAGGEDCRLRIWRPPDAEPRHCLDTVGPWGAPRRPPRACRRWGPAGCTGAAGRAAAAAAVHMPQRGRLPLRRRRVTPPTSWARPSCPAPAEASSSAAPRTARCAALGVWRGVCGRVTAEGLAAGPLQRTKGECPMRGGARLPLLQVRHLHVERGAARPYALHRGRVRTLVVLDPREEGG